MGLASWNSGETKGRSYDRPVQEQKTIRNPHEPSVKTGAAWSEPELANPHRHAEKANKVRSMFAAIAGKYDLNNRVHSLWRDQAWRRYAVKAAAVRPGDVVIDVALIHISEPTRLLS